MAYFLYRLRIIFTVMLVLAVIAGVGYLIMTNNNERSLQLYNRAVTAAIETAIGQALNEATRTAEAPLLQYQVVQLGEGENLEQVARRFNTTLEVIQMANGLAPEVVSGNGERIVVPVAVRELDPPRRLRIYTARLGDSLISLSQGNNIPLTLLERDNPPLVNRDLMPGDIIFIAEVY